MNKKAFIGATLITATVVGGVVYFRHKILEQVDKWLDDGEQVNRMLDMEEVSVGDPSPEQLRRIEEILNEAEKQGYVSGAEMHARHPGSFDDRGRPIRKQEEGTE